MVWTVTPVTVTPLTSLATTARLAPMSAGPRLALDQDSVSTTTQQTALSAHVIKDMKEVG